MLMRTTLTINDEILTQLKEVARKEKDKSFKDIVNETLRLGLRARREVSAGKPFKIRSRKMGTYPGLNYDNIEELLDQVEGVDRKW